MKATFTLIELLALPGVAFPRNAKRSMAFTLIELLVVIAIIAVLAALLLPALKRAKDMGHRVACLNNLKQFKIVLNNYSDDFNGYLVPYFDPKVPGETWYTSLPLLGYLKKSPDCPAEPQKWFDYALNQKSHASTATGKPMRRLSQFKYPSDCMQAMDSWRCYYLAYAWETTAMGWPEDMGGIAYRHSKGCCVLYMDGHVGWEKGPIGDNSFPGWAPNHDVERAKFWYGVDPANQYGGWW